MSTNMTFATQSSPTRETAPFFHYLGPAKYGRIFWALAFLTPLLTAGCNTREIIAEIEDYKSLGGLRVADESNFNGWTMVALCDFQVKISNNSGVPVDRLDFTLENNGLLGDIARGSILDNGHETFTIRLRGHHGETCEDVSATVEIQVNYCSSDGTDCSDELELR